jgi:hypothetical protein
MKLRFCRCRHCKHGRHSKYWKFYAKHKISAGRSEVKRKLKQGDYDNLPVAISLDHPS